MTADSDDYAAARAEVERQDRQVAGLRAHAARAGFALHVVFAGNGSPSAFVIARWGKQRALPDADAVAAFLRQVGAP